MVAGTADASKTLSRPLNDETFPLVFINEVADDPSASSDVNAPAGAYSATFTTAYASVGRSWFIPIISTHAKWLVYVGTYTHPNTSTYTIVFREARAMAATRRKRDAAYAAALVEARSNLDPAFDRWVVRALLTLAGDYDFFHPDVEPLFTPRDWLTLAPARGAKTRASELLDILIWRNFCFEEFRSIVRERHYNFVELLDEHFWHRLNEAGGIATATALNAGYWKRAYFWSNKFVHTHVRGIIDQLYQKLPMKVRNDDDWPDEIDMGPQTAEQRNEFAPLALRVTFPGSIELIEQFLVPFGTTGVHVGGRPAGFALNKTFTQWEVDPDDLGRIGFDPLVTDGDEWTLEFARKEEVEEEEQDDDSFGARSVFELEGGGPLRLRTWTWSGLFGRDESLPLKVALGCFQARQPRSSFLEPLKVYAVMHAIDVETMFVAIAGLVLDADERMEFSEPALAQYNAPEYDDHFRAVAMVTDGGGEYFAVKLDAFTRFEFFAMAPDYEFLLALPDSGWLVAFDEIMREPTTEGRRERDPLRKDGKLVFYKCSICANAAACHMDMDSGRMYCDRCRREAHST